MLKQVPPEAEVEARMHHHRASTQQHLLEPAGPRVPRKVQQVLAAALVLGRHVLAPVGVPPVPHELDVQLSRVVRPGPQPEWSVSSGGASEQQAGVLVTPLELLGCCED